jgi:rhamnosyltransferase
MLPTQASPQPKADYAGIPADRAHPASPRVLVLLAAYNGSGWIRAQMESILGQQDVNLTIAVRDDASTDGTRWELARFESDPRVKITAANTPGGSAARNFLTLIRDNPAGTFDFVAFADQDDLWNPDKLRRAAGMLTASGAAGYSSATVAAWEEDGREKVLTLSGTPTRSDFLFEGAGQGCTFVLSNGLYERARRFLIDHAQVAHGVHYHDWMVYALARSWGLVWCFDARPSMRYRQHATNDTGGRGTIEGVTRRLTLIRNGWYGAQLRAIAEVCRTAAPSNETVLAWHRILMQADGVRKRLAAMRFCVSGGRRRTRDNVVVALATLCGWI